MKNSNNLLVGISILFSMIGIICVFIVLAKVNTNSVIDWIFLMPLLYAVFVLVLGIMNVHKNAGLGVYVIITIMMLRYCISPVMNVYTNNFNNFSQTNFTWAIIYQCVEIVAVFAFLCIIYPNAYNKEKKNKLNEIKLKDKRSDLSIAGIFVILALVFIILIRDNGEEIWDAMRFFLGTERIEKKAYDSYSILSVQAIKAVIFITGEYYLSKQYEKNHNKIYVLLGCVLAGFNFMIYFGTNRSSVIQNAIASMVVILHCFKRDKRFIYAVNIPIIALMLISLIMIKNYGVDITESTGSTGVGINEAAKTLDAYFCGINNAANAHCQFERYGNSVQVGNIIRDFTDNFFLFKIPGLMWINKLFDSYISVLQIITQGSTAMVSVSGQMMFYFGTILGILADVFVQYIVIKFIAKFDVHVKEEPQISSLYLYTWMTVLLGMIPMYCVISIVWSLSNLPFFLCIFYMVNKLGYNIKVFKNAGH